MTNAEGKEIKLPPDFSPCDRCIWQVSNPLWDWSKKFAGQILLLMLILRLSADSFDETELLVIAAFAGAVGFDKFAEVWGWKSTVNGWVKRLFTFWRKKT